MHKSTSPRRKNIGLFAVLGTVTVALGSTAALIAGVTPARAANIASQADTQVAIFMVPLILLVMVLLFEAARFVWRGALPAQAAARPPRPTKWSSGPDGS